jgi:tRNA pseudouridine38-40 synthase
LERNILLTIEFDGSDFVGWQIQHEQRTVQGELTEIMRQMLKEPELRLTGSGRTDSGVHALGMAANFRTRHTIPLEGLVFGLNANLAPDIAILNARSVPLDFCARRWSMGKRYRYQIWNHRLPSALERKRAWHIHQELDLDKIYEASRYVLGRHDFSAFQASGCAAHHPIRDIYDISISRKGYMISFEFEGSAFLRHMVRNMVGAFVEVGKTIREPSWIEQLLLSRDRNQGSITAPAHGLYLVAVHYTFPDAEYRQL